MGLQFTIGGKDFGPLSSGEGQYALTDIAESAVQDNTYYHPKGTTGRLVNHGGIENYKLRLKARYISAMPYIDQVDDQINWEDPVGGIDITDCNGGVYKRCILDPGGMKPIREGALASGLYFVDVEMSFTCNGGRG